MRSMTACGVLLLASCGGYSAGSFDTVGFDFNGERHSVGCFDLSAARADEEDIPYPVVAITVGNHCDSEIPVDFTAVATTARSKDGAFESVAIYDPRGELEITGIEARTARLERFAYEAPKEDIVEICLDFAAFDVEEPGDRPAIVCIGKGAKS